MAAVFTTLGAPTIALIVKPLEVYVLLPLALLATVFLTALLGCRTIRKISISQMNAE